MAFNRYGFQIIIMVGIVITCFELIHVRKNILCFKRRLIIHILALVLIAGGVAFGVARYHFILMDTKIRILEKTKPGWAHTFVDARGTKRYKLVLNPKLTKAGFKGLFGEEGITIGK